MILFLLNEIKNEANVVVSECIPCCCVVGILRDYFLHFNSAIFNTQNIPLVTALPRVINKFRSCICHLQLCNVFYIYITCFNDFCLLTYSTHLSMVPDTLLTRSSTWKLPDCAKCTRKLKKVYGRPAVQNVLAYIATPITFM